MGDDLFLQSCSLSSMLVTQKCSASSTSPPLALRCMHEVRGVKLARAGLSSSSKLGFYMPVALHGHEPGSLAQLYLGFMLIQWEGHDIELNGHRRSCLKEQEVVSAFFFFKCCFCDGAQRGRLLLLIAVGFCLPLWVSVYHYDKSVFAVCGSCSYCVFFLFYLFIVAHSVSLLSTISYCLLAVHCLHF